MGAGVCAADTDPSVSAGPPAPPDRLEILEDGITSVPRDLKGLVRFPVDHWAETRNSLLAIGVMIALDKPLTRAWQERIRIGRKVLDHTKAAYPTGHRAPRRLPKYNSNTGEA